MTKIVIVGAGFAGLNVARALKRTDFEIIIVDKTNHHLFQPLLYQIATAVLSPGDIASPIREIVANQKNASVVLGDVTSIDLSKKTIHLFDGAEISYDILVLAPGSRHSYFGHPEWEAKAPGLKTIVDAISIREKILLSFEEAERSDDPEKVHALLRFIVVGGGPTGVEMAGAIAETAHKSLFNNFRKIKPEDSEIYLIEGENHILPSYPDKLTAKAKKDLEKMGVKVLLNTRVTEITSEGVRLGDEFLPAANVIWAAGNQASSLLKTLNVPLDRQGRVIVGPDLTIPGFPDAYVIGDAAHSKDKEGRPLPGIAPVAIQEGQYVAKRLRGKTKGPFEYWDKGTMATIGRAKAVAVVGPFKFSGFFAWIGWCLIHIFYLISFPNRFLVMVQWMFLYLFNLRRVRLITRPIEKIKPDN